MELSIFLNGKNRRVQQDRRKSIQPSRVVGKSKSQGYWAKVLFTPMRTPPLVSIEVNVELVLFNFTLIGAGMNKVSSSKPLPQDEFDHVNQLVLKIHLTRGD